MNKDVIAIIPAAGIGKRFGSGTNKAFVSLAGKPLILWPLQTLEAVADIVEIIPVLKKEDMVYGKKVFEQYKLTKIKRIAQGGKERQDSVYNGLKLVKNTKSIVIIHDGVRPLIEKDLIERAMKEFNSCDGVILGVPLKDTIKEAKDGIINKTLRRDSLWAVQTPQIFTYDSISSAYDKAMKEGFYSTDDAGLVERYGGKIKMIAGSYRNIKITTSEDLVFAEFLLSKKNNL